MLVSLYCNKIIQLNCIHSAGILKTKNKLNKMFHEISNKVRIMDALHSKIVVFVKWKPLFIFKQFLERYISYKAELRHLCLRSDTAVSEFIADVFTNGSSVVSRTLR